MIGLGLARRLKKKAADPGLKRARKEAERYKRRMDVAQLTVMAAAERIDRQSVVRVSVCAFLSLLDTFGMSGPRTGRLSEAIGEQAECLRTRQPGLRRGYVTFEEMLDGLEAETGWVFPPRVVESDRGRLEMSAEEMADYDVRKFLNTAMSKVELLWLWTLRVREGFGRVRLGRFSEDVRRREAGLTNEEAQAALERARRLGIEFLGFKEEFFGEAGLGGVL